MSWKEAKIAIMNYLKDYDEEHALDADQVNGAFGGSQGAERFRTRAILFELVVDGYIKKKLVAYEDNKTKYVYWGDFNK